MNLYAIGFRYKPSRMTIKANDLQTAQLQCQVGEVAVPTDHTNGGIISGSGKTLTPLPVDMRDELDRIKAARFAMLASCDWTQANDSPLTPEKKAEWAAYRQALRDITETQPNVMYDDVVWPEEPSK